MSGPPIWLQTLLALLAGSIVGVLWPGEVTLWLWLGDAFLLALKLLAVPLIVVSIVSGVASIGSASGLGRLGIRTLLFYIGTTAMAVPVGLLIALWIEPGSGLDRSAWLGPATNMPTSIISTWQQHPVLAWLLAANPLWVIVGSLLTGGVLVLLGPAGSRAVDLMDRAAQGIYALTDVVIRLAPLGVFALASRVTAEFGWAVVLPASKLVLAIYAGCLLHLAVNLNVLLRVLTPLSLGPFWRGVLEAQLVAFSTTTAAGTLPVTTACVRHNLGVSDRYAKFVLPVGTTINMDGTALYQVVTAIFVAQLYQISLGGLDLAVLSMTAVLASIGAASIPGGGLVVLSMVMTSVGLPLEGIALIAGIDRVLDMVRTATNVTSDALITVVLASRAGELNEATYAAAPE